MAKLYVIKEECLKKMKEEIQSHLSNYKNADYPEFSEDDLTELRGVSYPDDLVRNMSDALSSGVTGNSLFKVAKLLRDGLDISRLLASEEVIWVYLAHGPMKGVVSKIWDFSQLKQNDSEINYVQKHWFIPKQSDIMRNALASLWWGAEISKINDEEDPYRLTEILFSNYTLRVTSLAQVLRMREVLRGVLQWLFDHKENNRD